MQKQTFERALHQWPAWHESIEASRKKLGYDVHASPEDRIRWACNHVKEIKEQYQSELNRLELPPSFYQYWCNCLYNDYRTEDGEIDYSKITNYIPTESNPCSKALPELPCEQKLVWYEDEDIHSPWVRVEIMVDTRFYTKSLLNYSMKYAAMTIETFIEREKIQPHPVTEWLKGGRPLADEQLALECVHLKDDLKQTYVEIGQHYDWPLQPDSYGNLNQCSTARRYVKIGRKLRANTNH